jgi:hypothetical protein
MVKSTPLVPDLQRNEANVQHVFVETNWLVGYAAPAHQKVYAAVDLLKKANRGEVRLYLPSICLSECRRPIREKFQVEAEVQWTPRLRQSN